MTPNLAKWPGWRDIHIHFHFTHHMMEIYDMEFQYYHKIKKGLLITQLTFTIKCHIIVPYN
jgi:outer membrane phospholipase A